MGLNKDRDTKRTRVTWSDGSFSPGEWAPLKVTQSIQSNDDGGANNNST